jgi:two-component system, NtrC family, sensor kinase
MDKIFLLHTHSVMSLLLFLFATGTFVFVNNLEENTPSKKWFRLLYLGNLLWQASDLLRYSLHPSMVGSLIYQLDVALWAIPSFCLLEIAYLQFLYFFVGNPFERERKIFLYISIFLSCFIIALAFWNEFYNQSNILIFNLMAFGYGFIINILAMILCFRKAIYFNKIKEKISANGSLYMAILNFCYVMTSVIVITFGFYSAIGYWTFFLIVWIGNLTALGVYINFGAVPTSFQTKMIGFTFIIVMTVLMMVTLVFYPLLPPTEIEISTTQQTGLTKLIIIILCSIFVLTFILPRILRYTLTDPLQRLLDGVQKVNSGDLSSKVTVVHPDEIGNITSNFNLMTQSLKQSKDELMQYASTLELKVNERTAELQHSLNHLKETQAQLLQSEKLASLGELTAGIAHEIQNPLNFVNNFSELSVELANELKEEINKVEMDKKLIQELLSDITQNQEKITCHGKRASSIVKGMLEHSRTSTGIKIPTDINKLADECLRLAYHGLRAKDQANSSVRFNSDFKTDFEPDLPLFKVVPQDFGRVLLNLISNAFYAVGKRTNEENGRDNDYKPMVILSTQSVKNQLIIMIKDNGTGISESTKAKMFQPFFTTKPTGEGTGLGLSLAYDIITKGHAGTIECESVEGEWTTFTIKIS